MTPRDNAALMRQAHQARQLIVPHFPTQFTIETTSTCNLRCVMCPHGIGAVHRPLHMTDSILDALAEPSRLAQKAQLHGIGESFGSPLFWQLLQKGMFAPNTRMTVDTNLTMLDEGQLAILTSGRRHLTVTVALDAARAETYQRLRGGDFEQVLHNLERLLRARGRRKLPQIRLSMTIMRENIEEAPALVELASRMGVDRVYLWHLNRWPEADMAAYRTERDGWLFDYAQQGLWNYADLSDSWVESAVRRGQELAVEVRTHQGKSMYFADGRRKRKGRETVKDCRFPWEWAMVTSDGAVRPCCFATEAVGNLHEASFADIWNGPAMQGLRSNIQQGIIDRTCRGAACDYVQNMKARERDSVAIQTPEKNLELLWQEYHSGKHNVQSLPATLTIETSSLCNLRCVMCPQSVVGGVPRPRHLAESVLDLLASPARLAREVQLHGIGEPMASPSFWKALRKGMFDPSARVLFDTNLTLLDDANLQVLARADARVTVNVSLDAATSQTYRRIRGADFQLVTENIARLRAARGHRTYPMITMNMTLMRENIEEAPAFVELAHRLGADQVIFCHLNHWPDSQMASYATERDGWRFDYAEQGLWNQPQLSNQHVRAALKRGQELSIPVVTTGDLAVLFEEAPPSVDPPAGASAAPTVKDCRYPWEWAMVTSDGAVRPCCHAVVPVGNLHDNTFSDIWNGRSMQELRRSIQSNRIDRTCENASCKYVQNMIANDPRYCSDSSPEKNSQLMRAQHASGKTAVEHLPTILTVETTSICNLRCAMCPQSVVGGVERPRHLPEEFMDTLETAGASAREIQLHGIGEPMASPAFWRALERDLFHAQAEVSINTNLTLLNDRNLDVLMRARCKLFFNISVDAATERTYRRIRGANFQQITDNIRKLRQAREPGRYYPFIAMNMTLMRSNIEEATAFVELAHSLRVDRVYLWHLNRWPDEQLPDYDMVREGWKFDYAQEGLWNHVELSDRCIREAVLRGEEIGMAVHTGAGKSLFFDKSEAPVVVGAQQKLDQKPEPERVKDCRFPWEWAMITSDGNVRPCCYATKSLGNLHEASFTDIWNGENMQQLRQNIFDDRVDTHCRSAACKFVQNAMAAKRT